MKNFWIWRYGVNWGRGGGLGKRKEGYLFGLYSSDNALRSLGNRVDR